MHMADALLSPAVGGVMLISTAGVAASSIKKIQSELDDKKIPLMGVMGAFVFAAQMINFSIPATGSSGHIGGGMLLAILLGPYAGFLTMASVLLIQALFFADGGLLAFGANVFNLGFHTCFIAYPLIYKLIMKKGYSSKRIFSAAMISAIVGLQLGAFSVVLETVLSGKTELPFSSFVILMQPIHLAIGVVEGFVTAAVVSFVWKARPEIIEGLNSDKSLRRVSYKKVFVSLIISSFIIGGGLSWFASNNPDGLEWAMIKTAGTAELESEGSIYTKLSQLQNKIAFLPDYGFKSSEVDEDQNVEEVKKGPEVSVGTSVSGILGGAITLIFAILMGIFIALFKRKRTKTKGI
ncbi:MAG: energy-coupling factor ABC transporter permease [Clostridiaceae bacterium]